MTRHSAGEVSIPVARAAIKRASGIKIDKHGLGWKACLDGDWCRWEYGRTVGVAIKKLFIGYPEELSHTTLECAYRAYRLRDTSIYLPLPSTSPEPAETVIIDSQIGDS